MLNPTPPPAVAVAPKKGPGRPRKPVPVEDTREYTRGDSSSPFANIYGFQQLQRLHGNVDDLDLKLGWRAKEQMDNDAHCAAALDTLALGATARPIEVEPAKKALYTSDADEAKANEIAEFVRRCLIYLAGTHRDLRLTAFQLGREALKIGHCKAECVLRLMEGGPDDLKLVPDRIKAKNRYNSCFILDAQGNTVGIAAFTGAFAKYKDPYTIPGVDMYGAANAIAVIGVGWEILPPDKWLVVTNRPTADDSPLGRSALRPAYTPYRMKHDTWPMYLKCLDNTAMPHTVAEMPEHGYAGKTAPLDEKTGEPDLAADMVPMGTALLQSVQQGRQAGISVIPHTSKVSQLHSAQSGDPFLSAIGVYNAEITQAILLQPLATTTDKHMARAAGQVHQDILDQAIRHVRAMLSDAITRCCFAVWVRKNYDQQYWHLVPTCSFGEVELTDFAAWARAFKDLADAGLLLPSQYPHIWATLGVPQGDLEEFWAALAVDQELNQQLLAPQVSATGAAGPSQLDQFTRQETGKAITRKMGRKRANRQGVTTSV